MASYELWAKRFGAVSLFNMLLAMAWVAIPLLVDTRISRTIAGGSVGTWGYVGFLGFAIVGVLGIPPDDRIGRGNVHARVRMIALYQAARAENRLVIGTSNKSEYLSGNFSKFGDGGCDFAPLGDLYKTQVRG
ncbi:MAG: NAD(+) synthase, partial [Candidatus Geothermarchaeales archaeon]